MITIRKISVCLTIILAAMLYTFSAYAYNVVDLPQSMTLADALEIHEVGAIKSATVSNLADEKHITLTRDEIKDFYYSAANITVHRQINPTPFRGTAINFQTDSGVKSFYFNSGVQIGMYGKSNFICYEMEDYDLSKFMYLISKYEEGQKIAGAEVHVNDTTDFLKMPDDLWARSSISEAASRSLLPYELTNKYSSNISREEFCVLIGNFIAVVGNYASIETYMEDKMPGYSRDNFSDCIGRDKSIDILFNLGVVNGRGGEYFDPEGAITREEAAKMLTSAAELFRHIETNYKLTYSDKNSISKWAQFFVKWVTDNGIMNGVDDKNFEPGGSYTVQQAVATVSRLYNVCAFK